MSWGERSCKWLYDENKPCEPEMLTCNVNCQYYESNGKDPDSKKLNQSGNFMKSIMGEKL